MPLLTQKLTNLPKNQDIFYLDINFHVHIEFCALHENQTFKKSAYQPTVGELGGRGAKKSI